MRRELSPGVYVDDDGIHFDLAAMCLAAGYEPTPANQETLAEAIREARDAKWPTTPIVDVDLTPTRGEAPA